MSREQKFSDEFLNAFVDDQLSPDEKSRVYPQITGDQTLSREVCELRKLRDLVRLAYNDVEPPVSAPHALPRQRAGLGLAAALAVVLSGVVGWVLHDRVSATDANVHIGAPSQVPTSNEPVKIVVHLSEDEPDRVRQVLDDVEGLLQLYRASARSARVEVVMNGDGLSLVRADISTAPERVRRMQKEYDNLSFVACQNAIDRLKRDQDVVAKLLPGVVVIDSGMAQLMRRQQQGWAYIQA